MRIAYIAPYQGPWLVKKRPCIQNLSLGGKIKIELIAELLVGNEHHVEILSQGEVIERSLKFYPAFSESDLFHPRIPVHYSSAFPVRFVNGLWSSLSTLRMFKARHRASPYDAVLIYNLKPPQIVCANYAMKRLSLPVMLEYEDDLFMEAVKSNGSTSFMSQFYVSKARTLLGALSGALSGSMRLLSQVRGEVPKLVLCGVVGNAIIEAGKQTNSNRRNWVVYSGTHSKPQGLEQLITAWGMAKLPGWELHIAGHGALTDTLHTMAKGNPSIVFHGLLDRKQNAAMLGTGKIAIVPYDVSTTQGFSFKTIECLAAGLHVITTPLTALEDLEPELKAGITYIRDNSPATIAASLEDVIRNERYGRTVASATVERYGPNAITRTLDLFIKNVVAGRSNGGDVKQKAGVATSCG